MLLRGLHYVSEDKMFPWSIQPPTAEGNEKNSYLRKKMRCQNMNHSQQTWTLHLLGNAAGRQEGNREGHTGMERSILYYVWKPWRETWPKRESTLQGKHNQQRTEQACTKRCWQPVVNTACCDYEHTLYIILLHLELFTTWVKQGPCVPNGMAD